MWTIFTKACTRFWAIYSGALEIDPNAEDVHTFVEQTLTARVAMLKRLHTGRSRNDQVALTSG